MIKRIKELARNFKKEIKVYQLVLKDKRTPTIGKIFLGFAIGYLFLPFDLIPDFIPILGQLDDIVIVPALVLLGLAFIPKEIIDDCRKKYNLSNKVR